MIYLLVAYVSHNKLQRNSRQCVQKLKGRVNRGQTRTWSPVVVVSGSWWEEKQLICSVPSYRTFPAYSVMNYAPIKDSPSCSGLPTFISIFQRSFWYQSQSDSSSLKLLPTGWMIGIWFLVMFVHFVNTSTLFWAQPVCCQVCSCSFFQSTRRPETKAGYPCPCNAEVHVRNFISTPFIRLYGAAWPQGQDTFTSGL